MIKEYLYYQLKQVYVNLEPFSLTYQGNLFLKDTQTVLVFNGIIPDNAKSIIICEQISEVGNSLEYTYILLPDETEENMKNIYENICTICGITYKIAPKIDYKAFYESECRKYSQMVEKPFIEWLKCSDEHLKLDEYGDKKMELYFSLFPKNYKIEYSYNRKNIFLLNPTDNWNENFNALLKYKALSGDVNIQTKKEVFGIKLGSWLSYQRTAYTQGYIDEEKVKTLESIGVIWDTNVDSWNKWFSLLLEYKEEFGTLDIPKRDKYKDKSLGKWCQTQRNDYKNNQNWLTQDKIDKLNSIGFVWDPLEKEWDRKYEMYKRYIRETGITKIARRVIFEGEKLGVWVQIQRKAFREKKISEKRKKLLLELDENFFD